MDEITVLIVDDHPLFRQGVADALALEPDMRVVGQAASGTDALDLIHTLQPDVAILDISLPEINGQRITHIVVQERLPTRVLLLTGYDDGEQAIHAALAGAYAYCAKDIEPQNLTRAIREIVKDKYVFGDRIFTRHELEVWLEEQLEGARRSYSEPGSPYHPLSDREMEVLSCVVRGMSNKEIASLLGISHQTVKNHVTSILRKFGVEDRTQAVVYALKRGWVKLRDTDISKTQE